MIRHVTNHKVITHGIVSLLLLGLSGCMQTKEEHKKPTYDISVIFKQKQVLPLVIIGSGPAGLGAALYGAENMDTVVLKGNSPGGLLMYTSWVENWLGIKKILGPDLIEQLTVHPESVGATMLDDAVESVDFSQWPFILKTSQGRTLRAMAVIIATGASPSRLGVPGEDAFFGHGVATCAKCDARFCREEDVVVAGGGNSAAEEAMQLAQFAKSVTILVRKNSMRASTNMQERLAGYPNISIKYNVEVKKIVGQESVTGVELYNNVTKETEIFPTTRLFLAIGHTPNTQIFKDVLELDDAGYIKVVGRTQQTSTPGVFAAGEVEDHRYRQAHTSASDGIRAALDARSFLTHLGFNPTVAAELKKSGNLWQLDDEFEIGELESYDAFKAMMDPSQDNNAALPVMLDFYTQECPECKRLLPMLTSVAKALKDKIRVYKVDADTSAMESLVKKYVVNKFPCLLVVKEGRLIARYSSTAMTTQESLKAFVEQCLASE